MGTNNAESQIYTANQAIAASSHVTIVVISTLSSGSQETEGHDELQGARVFQKERNDECQRFSCPQVKLLVANAGDDLQYAGLVAQQIAYLKRHGEPIIGIVGMPVSTPGAIDGIRDLSGQDILVVSSTESSDALPATPSYFRVAPLDSRQGLINTQFVQKNFQQLKKVVIFYALDNPYSQTLATSFGHALSKNGYTLHYEGFQRLVSPSQRTTKIATDVQEVAQKYSPSRDTLIFCACYSDDLDRLLTDLRTPPYQGTFQNIPVDSGDGAYNLGGYNSTGQHSMNYQNIYFSAFAFPDEWPGVDISHCLPSNPSVAQRFFCDYADDFDPHRQHVGSPYGYTRADSQAILAYDAVTVLVTAYGVAKQKNAEPSANDIQQALLGGDGCGNFQGVSGQITFGVDGSAVDKALVMIYVNQSGDARIMGNVWGQLQVARSQCVLGP